MKKEPDVDVFIPYDVDTTEPPLQRDLAANSYAFKAEQLPEVHTEDTIPHVHLTDAQGTHYSLHVVPEDTPRDLVLIGLHYIALGVALNGDLKMSWDEKWAGPSVAEHHGWTPNTGKNR